MDLEIYQKVNETESLHELANVIRGLADDETGLINGRHRSFKAEKMALQCEDFATYMELQQPEVLTRRWGIRQQAMYLYWYESRGL